MAVFFWKNGFEFVANNRELYMYAEQFSNSPYSELVDHKELEKHFEPMIKVLQNGIEQKVIKSIYQELENSLNEGYNGLKNQR